MLNERFGFHAVDTLIVVIIIGVAALVGFVLTGKVLIALGLIPQTAGVLFIVGIGLIGLPLNVLNIVFAVRLLGMQGDMYGLLKPYAYATIGAAICFATLILAPIGMLIGAGAGVVLGIAFLRAGRPAEVEFV